MGVIGDQGVTPQIFRVLGFFSRTLDTGVVGGSCQFLGFSLGQAKQCGWTYDLSCGCIVFHDTLYTNPDRYDMVITNNTRWIISIMINHLPTHGIDLPNMNKTIYVSICGETHTVSFYQR